MADKAKAYFGDKLFLNIFALAGAAFGLANTALAWKLFGTSERADLWMTTIVTTQALVLMSQLGVEQAAVFSAEARARDVHEGDVFDRDTLTWALVSGLIFGSIALLLLPVLVDTFASGYNAASQAALRSLLAPMLLQVAISPGLYVLRQQLLMSGRPRLATVLNNCFGAIQLLCLSLFLLSRSNVLVWLAWSIGALSALIGLGIILLLGRRGVGRALFRWHTLGPLIRASVKLRVTHSVHNFFAVLLTNSALSAGPPGTVAVFQYAKKFADGLSSISVGPHASVYHAAQARAWAARDRGQFLDNVRVYLWATLPLLVIVTALFVTGVALLPQPDFPRNHRLGIDDLQVFIVLLSWQALISVETIPAGVIVLKRRPGLLLAVNTIFVALFFLLTRAVSGAPSSLTVATISIGCQVVSTLLFTGIARRLYVRAFGSA